jgi:hypothetical protein
VTPGRLGFYWSPDHPGTLEDHYRAAALITRLAVTLRPAAGHRAVETFVRVRTT